MADEQYRWLNRDVAERLLRGEPLDAVDADIRARADRLAETLDALAAEAAPVPPQTAELPGEAAALAAFRTASTARAASAAVAAATAGTDSAAREAREARTPRSGLAAHSAAPAGDADAVLVRLGPPVRARAVRDGRRARWGRPVRYGLVAAVAAGMLGGVTAVTGGGALSAFRDEEPEPSSSLSATQSPDRPLMSPTPNTEQGDGGRGAWGNATPEASPDDSAKGDAPSGEGTGGSDEDERSGDSGKGRGSTQRGWSGVLSACRDVRDGKELDAERRRALEEAAGGKGKGHLKRFCEGALAGTPGNAKRPGAGTGSGKGTGTGASDSGGSSGSAGGGDKNTRSGNDSDEDDDSDHGKGRGGDGNGDGKNRHGDGRGHGNGSWNGDGKNKSGNGHNKGGKSKSGKNKSGKGGQGNGGHGHRGQLAALTPVDLVARVTPS